MTSSVQNSNFNCMAKPEDQITKTHKVDEQEPLLPATQPDLTVALVHWGDRFEDFFDTLGMSFEAFCTDFTGGWLFNYIDALKQVGVRTVIFYFSARVSEKLRLTHVPTGATVCILPSSMLHRAVRNISERTSFPGLLTLASYLATSVGDFAKELRSEGCNAILCQEYEYARFDTCVLLGKLMHLPVFATFQGGSKTMSVLEYIPRRLAIGACNGLIIGSKTQIEQVQTRYGVPSAKIAQIFNPMDVATWGVRDRDRAELRAELGIPLDARVVVSHGRIEIHRKGLDILLEAWNYICRDRPLRDLRLLLVGTGTDAEELRARITTMQLQGIIWVDEYVRDRSAIQRYLFAADAYTLASRHEGFPVAPIEAMASGLPLVAADAPGVPDILDGGEASGGIVVPRGDAMALAEALGRILDDPAWARELGKRARCRAEKCFSLEAIGKQLREFMFTQKSR